MEQIKFGYGTFLFPFVIIDDLKTELDPLDLPSNAPTRIIKNSYIIEDFHVLISDDGFMVVLSEDKTKVVDFFNTFVGTMFLEKTHQLKISEKDLNYIKWDESTNIFSVDKISLSWRNHVGFERDNKNTVHRLKFFNRKLVSPKQIEDVLTKTFRNYSHQQLRDFLILLSEALTMLYLDSKKSAFLLGWFFIESWLEKGWRNYINNLPISKKEKEVLKEKTDWPTARYIETLHKMGKLNDEAYTELNKLRTIRNKIAHENFEPTEDDAKRCIYYGRNILNAFLVDYEKYIQDKIPISD